MRIGRCHIMMLLVVVRQAQCRGLSATNQRLHFPIGVKSWELIWKKRGFYHQSGGDRHCRLLVINWWHVQVRIVQFTWIGPLIIEATLVKEAVSIAPYIEQRGLRHHIGELLWVTKSFVAQKRRNFYYLVLCHVFYQRSLLETTVKLCFWVQSGIPLAVLSKDFVSKAVLFTIFVKLLFVIIWAWGIEVGLFVYHCVADHDGIWWHYLIILFLKCFLMQRWLWLLFITALSCNKTW